MYITISIEECVYDNTLADVTINKITRGPRRCFERTIATLEAIPMYQARAMLNALKAANPEDYKRNANVTLLTIKKPYNEHLGKHPVTSTASLGEST